MVEVPEPEMELALKTLPAPEGKPDTLKATASLK